MINKGLNREICINCRNKFANILRNQILETEYADLFKKWFWNKNDDMRWSKGQVLCHEAINKKNFVCPYKLEHIIKGS
jgi:hypothetical protein